MHLLTQRPGHPPGDDLKPSLSRVGHRMLINMDKALLASLEATYAWRCKDKPPSPPGSIAGASGHSREVRDSSERQRNNLLDCNRRMSSLTAPKLHTGTGGDEI